MKALWDNLFRKNASQTKITALLKETILFKDLEGSELEIVETIMNPRQFHAGEVIFRQGDGGVGMYLIVSGSVNIFLDEVLEDQEIRQSLVTRLGAGDFFGESALVIDGGKRSATVIAREDCELLGFFYPDLLQIIKKHPTVGNKILFRLGEVLGTRLRETNRKIITLISENENLKARLGKEVHGEGERNQIYST
jgi:CRP/FNR family cyclic AMP-dependent transcriptional regulator